MEKLWERGWVCSFQICAILKRHFKRQTTVSIVPSAFYRFVLHPFETSLRWRSTIWLLLVLSIFPAIRLFSIDIVSGKWNHGITTLITIPSNRFWPLCCKMNSLVWQVRFDWVGSFLQVRRTVVTRVHEAVKALALCHNVTPVTDDTENQSTRIRIDSATSEESDAGGLEGGETVNYQASSPDEVTMFMVIVCSWDWTRFWLK